MTGAAWSWRLDASARGAFPVYHLYLGSDRVPVAYLDLLPYDQAPTAARWPAPDRWTPCKHGGDPALALSPADPEKSVAWLYPVAPDWWPRLAGAVLPPLKEGGLNLVFPPIPRSGCPFTA